jgi:hypothetical protein
MAHFAKIENGKVTNVVVVDNEHETYGQLYLNQLGLEGDWVQTSYNANVRVKYAAIGDTYSLEKDRFEPSKKYASWIWNEELHRYQPPTPYPEDGKFYDWDEGSTSWKESENQPATN